MAFLPKLRNFFDAFRLLGVDYPVAAAKPGVGLQSKRVTQAGASPFEFVFADNGLADMASDDYDVIVQGENGDELPDYATRTAASVKITGGADTEEMTVIIVGPLAGQAVES